MHYAGLHRIEGECMADPSATYTFYWGKNGEIYGGHLFRAEVFSCEVFVLSLKG